MKEAVGTTPPTPLPYRARPPQVLLGVGAVLLVSAGAALASAHGGAPARLLLLALALSAAGFSLHAAWTGLRGAEEILAACVTGLGVAAGDLGRPELGGTPGMPVVLAVVFLVLHLAAPTTTTWPLAAWLAEERPDLVIHTGDVTLDGADGEEDMRFCAERMAATRSSTASA